MTEQGEYDLNEYQDVSTKPVGNTAVLEPEAAALEPATDQKENDLTPTTTKESTKKMSSSSTKKNDQFNSVLDKVHLDGEYIEMDTTPDYPPNVKTLVRLVADLPEGVTKQTGAQIIRLTMEAMGISMESVLSEAQSTQSDLLDSARVNLKKIEEYRTVIRRLESEIRFQQNKANELSEIIDLFILSNTSTSAPNLDGLDK